MKAILNYEFWILNYSLSIVHCPLSIALYQYTLRRTFPLTTLLLSPCYPPSYPLPKKEIFCHFLHNDSLCVCIFLQTAVFRITKQKTSFLRFKIQKNVFLFKTGVWFIKHWHNCAFRRAHSSLRSMSSEWWGMPRAYTNGRTLDCAESWCYRYESQHYRPWRL